MKKVAILLIVLSLIGRVVCCGKSVELSNEINTLTDKQNSLTKEIDTVILANSELTSFTKVTARNPADSKLIPVSYNFISSSAIALSQ